MNVEAVSTGLMHEPSPILKGKRGDVDAILENLPGAGEIERIAQAIQKSVAVRIAAATRTDVPHHVSAA